MKERFHMTYEIVTDASAQRGESAYHGFLPHSGVAPLNRNNLPRYYPALFTLRQAYDIMFEGVGGSGPIEADSYPCTVPRWFTRQQTQDWEHPCVSLSVHLPDEISDASKRRIARAFGVKVK